MNCWSRSTYGVVIGSINVFGFICTIIYIITVLIKLSDISSQDDFRNDQVVQSSTTILYIIMVLCFIALITSSLLIMGIIKRRSSLMKPWIYSAVGGIAIQIARIVINFFTAMVNDVGNLFSSLFFGLLILGLQYVIFYPIYTLYKDIRDTSADQEESNLSNQPQPPNYSEIEKGGETYN